MKKLRWVVLCVAGGLMATSVAAAKRPVSACLENTAPRQCVLTHAVDVLPSITDRAERLDATAQIVFALADSGARDSSILKLAFELLQESDPSAESIALQVAIRTYELGHDISPPALSEDNVIQSADFLLDSIGREDVALAMVATACSTRYFLRVDRRHWTRFRARYCVPPETLIKREIAILPLISAALGPLVNAEREAKEFAEAMKRLEQLADFAGRYPEDPEHDGQIEQALYSLTILGRCLEAIALSDLGRSEEAANSLRSADAFMQRASFDAETANEMINIRAFAAIRLSAPEVLTEQITSLLAIVDAERTMPPDAKVDKLVLAVDMLNELDRMTRRRIGL
ncbi:MAG: hypothetical protein KDH15_11540 [Rhodocyclaceae bacterium]|nr:hypothetical protein [Rhodocyclaceae bacterium]